MLRLGPDGARLDGTDPLGRIVEAVGTRTDIMVDGGVRSGLDVLKMLALGADGVLIGRAWAWAVAARGRTGVEHVLRILRSELEVAMSLTGITSIAAAYAFAFLEFPFRRTIFVIFLSTMMIPFEVTFFTNQATIVHLGWYDSYLALTVPFLATGFGAFLIRQAFLAIPAPLQDAAELDGAGHWRFATKVAVPLVRPSIAALALFSFFGAFNQYLWPLIVTKDERLRTVQIGLRYLSRTQVDQINVTFAGTVLAALPLFVLLLVFQKHLVRGLTAGAVKG